MKNRGWNTPDEITINPKKPEEISHRYDFVLMDLKIVREKDGEERECVGWWAGSHWDGLRLEESDNVTAWKRRYSSAL